MPSFVPTIVVSPYASPEPTLSYKADINNYLSMVEYENR
jgi:hypothetical protein